MLILMQADGCGTCQLIPHLGLHLHLMLVDEDDITVILTHKAWTGYPVPCGPGRSRQSNTRRLEYNLRLNDRIQLAQRGNSLPTWDFASRVRSAGLGTTPLDQINCDLFSHLTLALCAASSTQSPFCASTAALATCVPHGFIDMLVLDLSNAF